MTRKEANLLIIKRLKKAVTLDTDQRFCQILRNLGVVREFKLPMVNNPLWANEFNTESETTLKEMERIENEFNR